MTDDRETTKKSKKVAVTRLKPLLWRGFSVLLIALLVQGGVALGVLSQLRSNQDAVISDVGALVSDVESVRGKTRATSKQMQELSEDVETGLARNMRDGATDLAILQRSVVKLVENTGNITKQLEKVLENKALGEEVAGVIEDLIYDIEDSYDQGRKECLPVVRSTVSKLLAAAEQTSATARLIAEQASVVSELSSMSAAMAGKGDSARSIARQSRDDADAATVTTEITVCIAILLGLVIPTIIIRRLTGSLARVARSLNEGADQVTGAAGQMSSTSQSLAEGASDQAASLEETSAALEQLAAMTSANAQSATHASRIVGQTHKAAQEGDQSLLSLDGSMAAISESSNEISRINKVIEEIASQTNLLALNAAVEAARAGDHGRGFAVVADEVRNLAQRSSQAAKETACLIETAVANAVEGGRVAKVVGGEFAKIGENVSEVAGLVGEISGASNEQAQGVNQISTSVARMDQVTQQNAAGAEQSASFAEELSAQAEAVRAMVGVLSEMIGAR